MALSLLSVATVVRAQTSAAALLRPAGAAYDGAGNLFIADANRQQVIELSVGGTITVVAGNGTQGFAGDGGPALAAELNSPEGVAVGPDGTIYIADTGNQRIRAVAGGQITTFAGTGTKAFAGDGGAALAAAFNQPVALALDSSGALLVCDQGNQRVRRVSGGLITTLAGNGVQGFAGDGAAATSAELNEPSAVAVGADGRIYIADTGNQRVRVVGVNGQIATFAGTGAAAFSGDGASATSATLSGPRGLALDIAGNLYIADAGNHRLRRVTPAGTIQTVVGSGVQGSAGDATPASTAAMNLPIATAVSGFGWPLLADSADRSLHVLLDDGKIYAPAGLSGRKTQLSASTPNAIYGAARASMTVASDAGVARGSVRVLDAGRDVGQGTLAGGAATVLLSALAAGTHTITSLYAGDGVHPSATSTSSISIAPAPVVASAGSATVSYGAPLPTLVGSLTGVLPQDAGNVSAVFSAAAPSMPAVGSYPISAVLSGSASANYAVTGAADSGTLTVVPAATVAALSPPTGAYEGLPLQLSARVSSTTSGVPTGSIEFLDGNAVIASAPLFNGSATAVYLAPASGAHSFSVVYSGDANFLASSSAKLVASVNAMPDFGVSVMGAAQQTVLAGSSAAYGLSVASLGTPFTGAVMLSASGLPAGSSATFSPPTVVPGSSIANVTMTISTAAQTAQMHPYRDAAGVLACCLLVPAFVRRRRALHAAFICLSCSALILGLAGCGARTVSESALPSTSYTINVKATSTNLAGNLVVHSVAVTLALQ